MQALYSTLTAVAGYQSVCMHSAVTVLEWKNTKLHACPLQSPYCNDRIPNYNGRIPNYNGRIPNYNGRIPNYMHALFRH
jgi:hypothetical protein